MAKAPAWCHANARPQATSKCAAVGLPKKPLAIKHDINFDEKDTISSPTLLNILLQTSSEAGFEFSMASSKSPPLGNSNTPSSARTTAATADQEPSIQVEFALNVNMPEDLNKVDHLLRNNVSLLHELDNSAISLDFFHSPR